MSLSGPWATEANSSPSKTNEHDAHLVSISLYQIPIKTRMPLKFGSETLTSVICLRARVTLEGRDGRVAVGWGETPCSVQWVWPASIAYKQRLDLLTRLAEEVAAAWMQFDRAGHALELGYDFQREVLPSLLEDFNRALPPALHVPYLAALLCCSPVDIALHDAYGNLHRVATYDSYRPPFLQKDLSYFLHDGRELDVDFSGKYPANFMTQPATSQLDVWHLVGGLDPLCPDELTGNEPDDGYPVLLTDWIQRDGLKCLKIKLRGNSPEWDYQRLSSIGEIARSTGVEWLTADYNCTVTDPAYVLQMLDKLEREHPETYNRILYVEQPFPYDLEKYAINVAELAARKPLLMDESAHDWQHVRLGRSLGWNGVALKTCKTQTGAILSLCWAKAHRMITMVQDLTNPMLAQIPHVLLAAHAGTMMGVESNAMQFYPDASAAEAKVHPGLYQRFDGKVDFGTLRGTGFGYRYDEIKRDLPQPTAVFAADAHV